MSSNIQEDIKNGRKLYVWAHTIKLLLIYGEPMNVYIFRWGSPRVASL